MSAEGGGAVCSSSNVKDYVIKFEMSVACCLTSAAPLCCQRLLVLLLSSMFWHAETYYPLTFMDCFIVLQLDYLPETQMTNQHGTELDIVSVKRPTRRTWATPLARIRVIMFCKHWEQELTHQSHFQSHMSLWEPAVLVVPEINCMHKSEGHC